jgi:hypothetical protein
LRHQYRYSAMDKQERMSVPNYLLIQTCGGGLLALVLGLVLLRIDTAGLGTLIGADHPLELAIYCLSSIVVFTPLVFTTAVGLLAQDD